MFRSTAVAVVIAASLLSACGSDKADDSATTKAAAAPAATAPATTSPTPAATPATTTPAAPTVSKKQMIAQCHAAFDGVVSGLHGLADTATVSTGFTAYTAAVTKAQTSTKQINFDAGPKTSSACVQTLYVYAFGALKHYEAATTTWAACDQRKSCSDASVAPKLRKEWATGRQLLHTAETGFQKPGPAPKVPPTAP